ncbi:A24 family peptidase [Novosphingobium album (ex Hu et al. 2023)]|uniref:Prepilin peptidase n=1 Tax=Novosphingobium album (ex Hu et al. 2023) TaxID=2930093 RepID=A0ABT0AWV6_9SPHN|nr:prepilin peptidase [Novosphingobium album (ex Hu et al. 2023)]MCJ2177219.1 prepilin peptidase [Novosphingobium album (ex Hu et al. 2023)]
MSGGIFSYPLLAALAIALLVAAFTDLRRREIDNWLNAAIVLAAPLWWLAMGFGWLDMGFQIGLATVTFVFACILFATGQMGGGDVKLLSALALWFTPLSFAQLVVLMAVLGGGASVAMAAFNMKRVPGEMLRDGLAAVVALAWVWGAFAIVYSLATHRPLIDDGTVTAITALLQHAWAFALAGLMLVLIFTFGFFHIMKRQKSRLPIPYGIAIAAAGLWVLGEQTLSAARLAAQSG